MMDVKAMRSFGAVITSLVCGAFVACAGSDTPPVDDAFEDALGQTYGRGSAAGGAPAASAGSSSTPSGGRGGAPARPPAGGGGTANPPVASAGTGGAGAQPPGGDEPPPSSGGACDGFEVLNLKCNGGGCHGDGSSLGDFAASEEAALAVVGEDAIATCSGEGPMIDPANPRQSVIMQKVLGTATCGGQMPLGTPLEDSEIDCLEEWIGSL
jgi:hypothetical protein